MTKRAFIFDLNGTIIDDMGFHAIAWGNIINNELNGGLTHEQVKAQMYGKNEEVLVRIFGADRFTLEEMAAISYRKELAYQAAYKPLMNSIAGFTDYANQAKAQNIEMAIGSAAIMFNINFILEGLSLGHYFKSIVSADDVAISKPHPETFLKAALELGVLPENCIVFEDAPKGVEAAANAGMKAVALTTTHTKEEFEGLDNILFFIDDYLDEKLQSLL